MQDTFTKSGHKLLLNKKVQQLMERAYPDRVITSLSANNYQLIQKIIHIINEQGKKLGLDILNPKSSELFALVVMDEVATEVISFFSKKHENHNLTNLFEIVESNLSKKDKNILIKICHDTFPDCAYTDLNNHFISFMITNALINKNPAFKKYQYLVDNSELISSRSYQKLQKIIQNFYQNSEDKINGKNLLELLEEPFKKFPKSIEGQLEFIRDNWKGYLVDSLEHLLKALDLFKEEKKWGMLGPGESHIFRPGLGFDEPENFSPDRDWMPSLVLLAKNVFVWMHQLSKKYNRDIRTLDEIPEQELQELAGQGFRGLWLIGIWERSVASKRIKHLCGNRDAIASAYSLKRYQVSDLLGGEQAMNSLAEKAWRYGIRMGCDMVPNHMGIDSDWLYDHPDWFMQTEFCPFPSYSFSGENLSSHPEVEIYIEDGYYSRTDAAVVFKYIDHRDGKIRYIYHGNDGTSFPWNDTAQLNYLLPQVRYAVIEQILRIARAFPIIRFDAAMTLSKKHFQRLWFPEPGSGGDIPSRTSFSMSREEFDKLIPVEFWREVVDTIAEKANDTLLLAEAFWLMEGYFVRTLGMHRVYNSAFMNMMKNEENSKYRQSIKNILEFDPQILKRFVNFMSNPDEDTAIAQFGNDDKYFGTCTVMSTLPGLPMFAHGQVQGFHERYGMEYYKPYQDEYDDVELVRRHEREIFPLLRKRDVFCDVEKFHLFDFTLENGDTDENVFAYTNDKNGQRSLVLYHNKYAQTKGWVQWTFIPQKTEQGSLHWHRKSLASVMNIPENDNVFVKYRDIQRDLEFIRNAHEVFTQGLFHELEAFKYAVYTDFQLLNDDEEKSYKKLACFLQGGGTKNIEKERKRVMYEELYGRFDELISQESFQYVFALQEDEPDIETIIEKVRGFLGAIPLKNKNGMNIQDLEKLYLNDLKTMISIFKEKFSFTHDQFYALFIWLLIRRIGLLFDIENHAGYCRKFIEKYDFDERISDRLNRFTQSEFGYFMVKLIKILITYQDLWKQLDSVDCYEFMSNIFQIEEVCQLLECNEFEDIVWFKKESFDEFVVMLEVTQTFSLLTTLDSSINKDKMLEKIQDCYLRVRKAYAFSEFKVQQFLDGLK